MENSVLWAYASDERILEKERELVDWTVEQQAHAMGLDRRDFYRALKRELPSGSAKQKRFIEYVARTAETLAEGNIPGPDLWESMKEFYQPLEEAIRRESFAKPPSFVEAFRDGIRRELRPHPAHKSPTRIR